LSRSERLGQVVGKVPSGLWALLGGATWALCFGERGLLLAPWLALAPIFFLLGRPRAVALAWLHGTAFWLGSLYWIVPTLMTFGRLPATLATLGLLLLAAFLSLLFWVPFGFFGRRLWRARGWPLYLGLPALWTALEWLREYIFSGFPWNLAAYAAVDVPGARPLTAIVGAYGLSFLLLVVNTAVALSLRDRRWKPALIAGAVGAAGLLVGLAISPGPGLDSEARLGASVAGSYVRVLQPNIYNLVEWDRAQAEANYRSAMSQADAACEAGVLVILPESATWPYVYGREPRLTADLDRLAERGCRLMVNSISAVPTSIDPEAEGRGETYYNSALLIGADGIEGRYDKRHLVPFGEYVPFGGLFAWLDKLARMAGDFAPGSEPGLLAWNGEEIGTAICYEVVYAGNVALQVQAGASLLVTTTNDAWYGDSTAPWQHLRAAQFRAAEHSRTMLRSAISGVSAVIAPDGSLVSHLGVGERGVLEARVAGRRRLNLYTRAPWLVPLVAALLALAAYANVRGRQRSDSAEEPAAGPAPRPTPKSEGKTKAPGS